MSRSRNLIGLAVVIAAGLALPVIAPRDGVQASPLEVCDVSVDPGSSLPRVLDRLPRNRTVCLHRGVHEWSGGLSLRAPRTTIRNYPGERATMRGLVRIEVTAPRSVIKNLTLNGRSDQRFLSPLIYADRAVLRNNEITNGNTAICVHIDSYNDSPPPHGVVIDANRIHDCGVLPPLNHDHGIYVGDAVGTVIRDNWIYDNADRGIQLYPNADSTTVTGNVIAGNGQGIILGGDGEQAAENNLVAHNVISGSILRHNVEDSWDGTVGTGNVVRDNCVWTKTVDPHYSGEPAQSGIVSGAQGFTAFNNTVANPRYVAAARHNFRLRPSSPCSAVVHDAPGVPGP